MTDYVKSTNFASKDALATGNPLKIVKGTEIDTEFNNIAVAVATKADLNSPTFIGTPTLPTGTVAVTQSAGNNTTAVATTAFVQQEITAHTVNTAQIEDAAVTAAKLATGAAVSNIGYTPANSTATVNLTGDQTVTGTKTFTAGIRFNDGTTQSSAAGSTTVLDAVGCVAMFWYSGGSNLTAGSTISGSNLFRFTTISGSDNALSIPSVGGILDIQGIFSLSGNLVNRTTAISGNSKTLSPVSGTWRFMCFAPRAIWDGYSNRTSFPAVIAVRIS